MEDGNDLCPPNFTYPTDDYKEIISQQSQQCYKLLVLVNNSRTKISFYYYYPKVVSADQYNEFGYQKIDGGGKLTLIYY